MTNKKDSKWSKEKTVYKTEETKKKDAGRKRKKLGINNAFIASSVLEENDFV